MASIGYLAVTCPTFRIQPAIIAQAAATAAVQLDGRFVLGVGSGEALNEHVLGDQWPSVGMRLEMLDQAMGHDMEGFFTAWEKDVLPALH
jgi:alkanesulfonate monooxygenase SsuD/methylene tetrahydromethanopterin reductase-like flavin-dependent oxidoreductase (luciferase family)